MLANIELKPLRRRAMKPATNKSKKRKGSIVPKYIAASYAIFSHNPLDSSKMLTQLTQITN